MKVRSLRQRRRRVPAPVVDAGLAVALAVAITIAIPVAPLQPRRPDALAYALGLTIAVLVLVRRRWPLGVLAVSVAPLQPRRPDALAYALGLTIAVLVLVRRRWPLAVLAVSAATLQLYYVLDYPGIFPAVPLSVALASAWAAGHQRWALLVAAWYGAGPLMFRIWADPEPLPQILSDSVPDLALFAAVLLLGEAVRSRRALALEEEKSERLLLNMVPASIAARLKQTQGVIADAFPEVTVLFADLVDFTPRSQQIAPEQMVQFLNELFSVFDQLAKRHGLEKIKTIGDAYMVAGGLPDPRPDHAQAAADMALAMREEVARRADPSGRPLQVRIGIDTGPVVAGVIGTSKFSYDLWGDTVNTASRMESDGVAGCIQVTARTFQCLRDGYRFERRGSIAVKGKGEMVTYFLLEETNDRPIARDHRNYALARRRTSSTDGKVTERGPLR